MEEMPALQDSSVLIVDDDGGVRSVFCRYLTKFGCRTREAANGAEGLTAFRQERPEAVLLDLRMPGMDGMDVLRELKQIDAAVPVIIVTGHGDIPQAVEAIKLGAFDFLAKPPELERLVVLLKRAMEIVDLRRTVKSLQAEATSSIEQVLGKSEAVRSVAEQIRQVSHSDFSLIIQGETGTGKSYIARMIHERSRRASAPFVSVDLGAIPESLMESELFGHEKGAYTGADRRKQGYFEAANGGTLFIDELQNITPAMQAKLLTAIEERRVRPLGSSHTMDVDIRIIGATNIDLRTAVGDGRIREDLYYRLGEFVITLPPMRERTEDIRFLAERFAREAGDDLERRTTELTDEAVALLLAHPWPGNIRELKNVVRRAVLLAEDGVILPEHVQFPVVHDQPADARQEGDGQERPLLSLAEHEKQTVLRALDACAGNKTRTAAMLAIDYKTLLRKLKKYA